MAATASSTLSSQLRLAVLRLSRRLRQQTAGEITASQLSALVQVAKYGEVSLGELAGIEQIAPPTMTRIAARLEDQGLLERRVDAADRRVSRVAVTPVGMELLSEIRTRRDAYLAKRLADFTPEERVLLAQVVPLLERLASEEG